MVNKPMKKMPNLPHNQTNADEKICCFELKNGDEVF